MNEETYVFIHANELHGFRKSTLHNSTPNKPFQRTSKSCAFVVRWKQWESSMRYLGLVVAALISFAVCGCSKTLVKPAVDQFTTGYNAATKVVTDAETTLRDVGRRRALEARFYRYDKGDFDKPPLRDDAKKFADIVCVQSDSLDDKKAALATLEAYRVVLETTANEPKEDVLAILKSIRDNWASAEALRPRHTEETPKSPCLDEVQNLLKLKQDRIPELAPAAVAGAFAAFEAAKKLFQILEKVAVTGLGIADDAVRTRKISAYVKASKDVVDKALENLVEPSPKVFDLCELDLKFEPPCAKFDSTKDVKEQPFSALDGVGIAAKWAALREPWHTYLAMKAASDGYALGLKGQHKPDVASLRYLLDKQQTELAMQIVRYRTMASTATPGDVARAMRKAQNDLVRLAQGDITAGEAWAVLKDFADRVKSVADESKNAKDALKELEETIDALRTGTSS